MTFNANEFRSRLQYGGVRPNLFKVSLSIPGENEASTELSFMARAASMPAFVTGFTDQFYFGRRVSFFGDREYQDWSIEIINDEDYVVRNALESWQARGAETDWDTQYVENKQGLPLYCDATITSYGKEGNTLKSVTIKNAFPIMLGPLEYNWEENNRIQTFTADFRFDYFVTNNDQ
jgi:hypothetical protein